MQARNYTIDSHGAQTPGALTGKPPRLVVILDGVRIELDDAEADAGLVEEISRVVKGLFKILEKRAQQRATA